MGAPAALLASIERELARTAPFTGVDRLSPRVRAALAVVPREAFVPDTERGRAYVDRALPIGHRQTISQPFIVALMTELLELGPADSVLEVGTGSGYQAAILARLGCTTVAIRTGDGAEGWLDHAPFDAVIVTAAAARLPPAWLRQLAPGGRLVAPLGDTHGHQMLTRFVKQADGGVVESPLLPVAFVPLRRHPPPPAPRGGLSR